MSVEELFRAIDSVLRIGNIPNLTVLILSAVFVFALSLPLLLTIIERKEVHSRRDEEGERYYIYFLIPLIVSFFLMLYGLIESISSLTITNVLVLGLSVYILSLIYIFLKSTSKKPSSLILLFFYIDTVLFATTFSSKALINGIDATETTTDVLQIWYAKHFYFSRHAGWYDLAPIDAILKNYLMNILGVKNPYDPLLTTFMYTALAISFITALFTTIKKMGFKGIGSYALALLLSASNAYVLLLGMSSPPTNFSLVFSMIVIFLITSNIYNTSNTTKNVENFPLITFTLLFLAAVLAHPMAMIVPIYILAVLIYLIRLRRADNQRTRLFFLAFLISVSVFLLKAIYTGLSEGLSTMIRLMAEAFVELSAGIHLNIQAFPGSPVEPPKSILISYTALPAFLGAIFVAEFLKKLKKNVDCDDFILFTFPVSLVFIFIGFIVTIVVPYSRYTAVPAVTLGAFQATIYLLKKRISRFISWRKLLLASLIGLMTLISVLSPNALTEQYNVFTGGRWPRVENFVLSEFVFDHVDQNYAVAVFYGTETARLKLYFSNDILLYGHPYLDIDCLIVERLLIPGIVNTRSYWDFQGGRFFLTYGGFVSELNPSTENIVLNAWRWVGTWS